MTRTQSITSTWRQTVRQPTLCTAPTTSLTPTSQSSSLPASAAAERSSATASRTFVPKATSSASIGCAQSSAAANVGRAASRTTRKRFLYSAIRATIMSAIANMASRIRRISWRAADRCCVRIAMRTRIGFKGVSERLFSAFFFFMGIFDTTGIKRTTIANDLKLN